MTVYVLLFLEVAFVGTLGAGACALARYAASVAPAGWAEWPRRHPHVTSFAKWLAAAAFTTLLVGLLDSLFRSTRLPSADHSGLSDALTVFYFTTVFFLPILNWYQRPTALPATRHDTVPTGSEGPPPPSSPAVSRHTALVAPAAAAALFGVLLLVSQRSRARSD